MGKAGDTIRREFRELVPATIYFLVTFNAIALTKYLLLREYHISATSLLAPTIGALVAAKAMLIADFLPFMEPFPRVPILYNVLWKTVFYWVVFLLVQVLEDAIPLLWHHSGLGPLREELNRPHFWVVQIWLAMVLLVYCTIRELVAALGPDRARELFLGKRRPAHGA